MSTTSTTSTTSPTQPTLPKTQTSIIFNTTTNALSLTTSAPLPPPSILETEHLIAVHSTAITNGELTWGVYVNWPEEHVPCYDVSGTVLTAVKGSRFSVGDTVFGRIMANREGTARQYATILPSECALLPPSLLSKLSMSEASSVPMSALTAWQAIFEKGQLVSPTYSMHSLPHISQDGEGEGELVSGQAEGKRVLVLGAAGGVGVFACQFAKVAGAYVVGTASQVNDGFVRGLGVDGVVDYRRESMREWVGGDESKKFDLVLDCVGGASMLDGWHAVKAFGTYISVAPGFREPDEGKPEGVRSTWFVMESRGSELAQIAKLMERGLVRTAVDSVWKMEDWEKAFAKTATGHARGKVVIRVAEGIPA